MSLITLESTRSSHGVGHGPLEENRRCTSTHRCAALTPGGIFDAYKNATITTLGRADIDVKDEEIGLTGSPTQVAKSFTKQLKGKGVVVTLEVEESAEFLLQKMQEKFII